PQFREAFHQVGPATVRPKRHTAGERLAVRGEIGCDSEILLRATGCETEAGDDFIKDQDDPKLLGDSSQALEESILRWQTSVNRFHNHTGNVLRVLAEDALGAGDVVE